MATADGVFCAAAVLGGAALARLSPRLDPAALGGGGGPGRPRGPDGDHRRRHHREPTKPREQRGLTSPGRAYLGLLGLTILNPATIVYFGALVLGRRADDGVSAWGQVLFVVGAFVASASWQLLLAGGGSLVGRLLTGPRGRLTTALVSSGVIAVLAVGLVTGS